MLEYDAIPARLLGDLHGHGRFDFHGSSSPGSCCCDHFCLAHAPLEANRWPEAPARERSKERVSILSTKNTPSVLSFNEMHSRESPDWPYWVEGTSPGAGWTW